MAPEERPQSGKTYTETTARSAVWLPRNIKFVASFHHRLNHQWQQRQWRLRDPMGSFQTCWRTSGHSCDPMAAGFLRWCGDNSNDYKIWRSANVIAIRKHGKPLDDPTSYRPISLLCCCYKLLERLLLTRLAPILRASYYQSKPCSGRNAKRVTKYSQLHLTSSQGF